MDRFKGIYRIESSRFDGWDYGTPGWYFITLCTKDREEWFGDVVDGAMERNDVGEIAYRMFIDIPNHHKNVRLDEFVIMPNHIHGIIVLCDNLGGLKNGVDCGRGDRRDVGFENGRDVACNVSTTTWKSAHMSNISPKSGSLGSVVRSFKSAVTNWCYTNGHPDFAWQSRFYDHIIRDGYDLDRIRQYIVQNPVKWDL